MDAFTQMFGRCNWPKTYPHGNQTVVRYFNNLTAFWDELDMLLPPLECHCNARRNAARKKEQQKLIKLLHPLPSLDRVYLMITWLVIFPATILP